MRHDIIRGGRSRWQLAKVVRHPPWVQRTAAVRGQSAALILIHILFSYESIVMKVISNTDNNHTLRAT